MANAPDAQKWRLSRKVILSTMPVCVPVMVCGFFSWPLALSIFQTVMIESVPPAARTPPQGEMAVKSGRILSRVGEELDQVLTKTLQLVLECDALQLD